MVLLLKRSFSKLTQTTEIYLLVELGQSRPPIPHHLNQLINLYEHKQNTKYNTACEELVLCKAQHKSEGKKLYKRSSRTRRNAGHPREVNHG